MKSKMKLAILLFLVSPMLSWGQNERENVRVATLAESNDVTSDPKYKVNKPNLKKLSLKREDLSILCHALNLSEEDSVKCNADKIWMALTDPSAYHSTYMQARMFIWDKYNKPFSSGWALMNEREYERVVLLEGFFNPLIYGLYLSDFERSYSWLTNKKELLKLSAIRKLKDQSKSIDLSYTKETKARQAFVLINDSLKQHGYVLMIMQPKMNPKEREFPFDAYNVISVRQGFEKDIVRIFKKLGLKIEIIDNPMP